MRRAANRGPDGQRGGTKPTTDLLEEQNISLLENGFKEIKCFLFFFNYWFSPPPFSLSTHILTVTRIDAGAGTSASAPFISFEGSSKTTDIQSHYFGTMICCLRL